MTDQHGAQRSSSFASTQNSPEEPSHPQNSVQGQLNFHQDSIIGLLPPLASPVSVSSLHIDLKNIPWINSLDKLPGLLGRRPAQDHTLPLSDKYKLKTHCCPHPKPMHAPSSRASLAPLPRGPKSQHPEGETQREPPDGIPSTSSIT